MLHEHQNFIKLKKKVLQRFLKQGEKRKIPGPFNRSGVTILLKYNIVIQLFYYWLLEIKCNRNNAQIRWSLLSYGITDPENVMKAISSQKNAHTHNVTYDFICLWIRVPHLWTLGVWGSQACFRRWSNGLLNHWLKFFGMNFLQQCCPREFSEMMDCSVFVLMWQYLPICVTEYNMWLVWLRNWKFNFN